MMPVRRLFPGKGCQTAALALLLALWAAAGAAATPTAPVVAATPPAPAPAAAAAAPVPAAPPAPLTVRVGVGRSLSRAELGAGAGLTVADAGGRVLLTAPANQRVQFTVVPLPAGLTNPAPLVQVGLAGAPPAVTQAGPFRIQAAPPAGPGPAAPLVFKERRYRGEFEVLVSPKDQQLSVVNVVGVEDYLRGVLGKEMGSSWPVQALRAQAVAARTYALKNRGAFKAEGFDLTDDTSSQVYLGMEAEHPNTDAAVAATAGQVALYQGALITAFYYAGSGGHTEDNEAVFVSGAPLPYLRGVPDFDQGTPWYRWQEQKSAPDVVKGLQTQVPGLNVGELTAIQPAGSRGAGGRWSHWRVTGTGGAATVTGSQVRFGLGLLSNPREVTVKSGGLVTPERTYAPAGTVAVLGAGGQTAALPLQRAAAVGGGRSPAPVLTLGPVVARGASGQPGPAVVTFVGGGKGHGVGMSQWGARAMADKGMNYVDILTHYYTGVQIGPYPGP